MKKWRYYLFVICMLVSVANVKAEDNFPKAEISLTQKQEQAIELKTVVVKTQPLIAMMQLNGTIHLLPNHEAVVTSRISAQLTNIYVNLGDQVKRGQPLAKLQSRLVGEPPPSVNLLAPIDGVIDAFDATLGQAIDPNTVLFRISDRTQMLVIARVYEEDLGKVKVGQDAIVNVLSYPDKKFNGRVSLIEPDLDANTRTVNIRIVIDNPENLLKPDMFAKVDLVLHKTDSALMLSDQTVLEANNEKFVFVKKKHQFRRVIVTIGASENHDIEIIKGLAVGDEVVTQGNRQLYTLWLTGGRIKSAED